MFDLGEYRRNNAGNNAGKLIKKFGPWLINSCRGRTLQMWVHTKRIFFEILLNQPKIRLYLPFSD